MRLKEQSQFYARSGSGAPQNIDLMTDFGLELAVIAAIQIIIRGNMVAAGGGAISGFHRDAPAGMITKAKLWGGWAVRGGQRTIIDMPPQQMCYPGFFMAGVFHAFLRTSSGAGNTDPFRATIPLPLIDPNSDTARETYIDCRDYTSLRLDLQNETDANLATTNLSSVAAVEYEVKIITVEDGPRRGAPHYEPNIVYKEIPASSASTRLSQDASFPWDGDLWALWFQQHDDSGAGDAERVDGLVRALAVTQGKGEVMPYTRWDALRRSTWEKYPYTQSTTEVAGIAAIQMSVPLDSARGQATVIRDTSSANPLGVTAITPAASDALFMTGIAAEPVHGAP